MSQSDPEQGIISFNLKPGGQRPPPVGAGTWLVADADTGEVLASRDPRRKLAPASTLKILTALTLAPRLKPDSEFRATLHDVSQPGTKTGIRSGASYPVADLLRATLIRSANDAASALANAYGGWDRTIKAMNAEAARLHANDTIAMTPNGLDRIGQDSSAFDLAIIFRQVIKNPRLREIIAIKQTTFPGTGRPYILHTENRLLLRNYPGLIGGKTGFTSRAGNTFVVAAKRNGRTLIASMMRASTGTANVGSQLLDWGFANADNVNAVDRLPDPDPVTVEPVQQPAIQMNQFGKPLAGQENQLRDSAQQDAPQFPIRPQTPSPVPPGRSATEVVGWSLLALLAVIVAYRVAAVIRRRRALGGEALTSDADRSTGIGIRALSTELRGAATAQDDQLIRTINQDDQPGMGKGTKPIRS